MNSGHRPFRWLPKQGEPCCVLEFISQWLVRWFAYLPVYTAIVTTITLVIVFMWGIR